MKRRTGKKRTKATRLSVRPRRAAVRPVPPAPADDPEAHLAPYAMRAAQTRGRLHREKEHAFRTAFQRDRDRIIHSRAFRRLEYKTQVFLNHEGDHFRTRLTHSIEVSQVGRTVARALGLNRDLVEALSLAHDLGHTPFGHLGEEVLDVLMRRHGGYNHNRQSLRIVEILEDRYPEWPGLNLTYEVREGIAKHSGPINVKKDPEFAAYGPKEAPPLEAQMIDIVDEIGYNHHDVDDGVRSGLLPAGQLAHDVPLFGDPWRSASRKYPRASERQHVAVALTGMIDALVTDLVEASQQRIRRSGVASVEEVRSSAEWLIGLSPRIARRNAELKSYLKERLYTHERIERVKDKSRRILKALFDRYMENPLLLAQKVRDRFAADGRERVICDYVAGMTDRFAIDEYRRLFSPDVLP
ncbi:MAG TPA: deoxyguanosinetriphosphate triphosphohydrolase [Candidatus Saccharimonadales bacterium]|nr:deoxyguanosinetriphosphate triphosphohydrolase [Candidatus Saccharimonadales bacterium]